MASIRLTDEELKVYTAALMGLVRGIPWSVPPAGGGGGVVSQTFKASGSYQLPVGAVVVSVSGASGGGGGRSTGKGVLGPAATAPGAVVVSEEKATYYIGDRDVSDEMDVLFMLRVIYLNARTSVGKVIIREGINAKWLVTD